MLHRLPVLPPLKFAALSAAACVLLVSTAIVVAQQEPPAQDPPAAGGALQEAIQILVPAQPQAAPEPTFDDLYQGTAPSFDPS